jgi:hypothetical protein
MASGHLWINEKRYNKCGRVGGKTLIGNWQEERRLELDGGLVAGTMVDTNRKGAESTQFLVSSEPRQSRSMSGVRSEHHAQFTEENSDVTLLRPPQLGVRTALRAQAILDEAKARVREEEERRRRVEAATWRSSQAGAADATRVVGPPVMTVDPTCPRCSYLNDVAITAYTGDPTTRTVMRGIPGRTSVATGAPNPLAKTHNFSLDKYQYAISRA